MTVVDSREWLERPGTVGQAVQGGEVRIYDDAARRLGAGEIGEVYTRLEFLPEFTYHQLPDKRAEIDREGFITSGDVGYLDEAGYLFLCDRKRDMVISGGVNIYPAEIEAVLINCPGVKDCAVFGVPDGEFGEALLAVIEPQPGIPAPRDRRGARVPGAAPGRLQGAQAHRVRPDLPREDLRQDLQAPPARSVLGECGAGDLDWYASRACRPGSELRPNSRFRGAVPHACAAGVERPDSRLGCRCVPLDEETGL